uniref:NADH dehydrogenase subunit 5 n=1 Tax=Parastrongyloides trichosuri TaxID=131310 RepID=A0A0N4ZMW0_PARTI
LNFNITIKEDINLISKRNFMPLLFVFLLLIFTLLLSLKTLLS